MDELTDFEAGWRYFLRLCGSDKARFVRRCRDNIAERMAMERARRGGGGPAPLASLGVDDGDFGGDDLGQAGTSLESLSLGGDW